jgi:hypothetical protein
MLFILFIYIYVFYLYDPAYKAKLDFGKEILSKFIIYNNCKNVYLSKPTSMLTL